MTLLSACSKATKDIGFLGMYMSVGTILIMKILMGFRLAGKAGILLLDYYSVTSIASRGRSQESHPF